MSLAPEWRGNFLPVLSKSGVRLALCWGWPLPWFTVDVPELLRRFSCPQECGSHSGPRPAPAKDSAACVSLWNEVEKSAVLNRTWIQCRLCIQKVLLWRTCFRTGSSQAQWQLVLHFIFPLSSFRAVPRLHTPPSPSLLPAPLLQSPPLHPVWITAIKNTGSPFSCLPLTFSL